MFFFKRRIILSEGCILNSFMGCVSLSQIICLLQVKDAQAVGIIKEGTIVYVEAVAQHKEHKIMYRVLNQWVPYYYFKLIII